VQNNIGSLTLTKAAQKKHTDIIKTISYTGEGSKSRASGTAMTNEKITA
jgi:hypothetical protein